MYIYLFFISFSKKRTWLYFLCTLFLAAAKRKNALFSVKIAFYWHVCSAPVNGETISIFALIRLKKILHTTACPHSSVHIFHFYWGMKVIYIKLIVNCNNTVLNSIFIWRHPANDNKLMRQHSTRIYYVQKWHNASFAFRTYTQTYIQRHTYTMMVWSIRENENVQLI